MIISDAAIPYIKLQRTDYSQHSDIKRLFSEDMGREYNRIKSYLPATASSILDIGCGVAGIDVFLDYHFRGMTNFYLLDRSEVTNNIYYGCKESPEFYNSLQVARDLLELNGVQLERIFLQEATNDYQINFNVEKFDVIISLISWGFHYPVSTYLPVVLQRLNGVLILDVRKGTNGIDQIKNNFNQCKIIYEAERFIRLLAEGVTRDN